MEPLYFGPRRRLFGLRSEAQGEPRRTAIVVCHSWGVEYMRSYRALYLLAQQLAMRGFDTLRFDYSGTGDSADGERGITLAQWIEDIRCAARELQELDRVHYARKNRYLPRELRLESLPGEMLGVPWPRALDEAVSGLSRRAPAGRATVLRLRSADVPPAVPEGEEIRLPDPGHWNDVTWLTRPWIPVNSQRTIVSELTERLA